MTPEQIRERAIEAAATAMLHHELLSAGCPVERWQSLPDEEKAYWKGQSRVAIAAYEAEMWRPIEEAPHAEPVILWSPPPNQLMELRPYSTGRASQSGSSMSYHAWATHFRPLPQPPEVK